MDPMILECATPKTAVKVERDSPTAISPAAISLKRMLFDSEDENMFADFLQLDQSQSEVLSVKTESPEWSERTQKSTKLRRLNRFTAADLFQCSDTETEREEIDDNGGKLGDSNVSNGLHRHRLSPADLSAEKDAPALSWRSCIEDAFKAAGFDMKDLSLCRPIQLQTMASGTGAPAVGLHLMGIPFTEVLACDPKPSTFKALQCWHGHGVPFPVHHLDTVDSVLAGSGPCKVHGQTCPVNLGSTDLLVAGFPCAPFSTQRAKRFSGTGWRDHPETHVMFDVCRAISRLEPKLAILENVPGFLLDATDSPLDCLLSCVNAASENPASPMYAMDHRLINSKHWLDASRDRVYMLLVHRSLGPTVLKTAMSLLDTVLSYCAKQPPVGMNDMLMPEHSTILAESLAMIQAGSFLNSPLRINTLII